MYNKPTRCTIFSLYCVTTPLHILSPFVAHHQETECTMWQTALISRPGSWLKSKTMHQVGFLYEYNLRCEVNQTWIMFYLITSNKSSPTALHVCRTGQYPSTKQNVTQLLTEPTPGSIHNTLLHIQPDDSSIRCTSYTLCLTDTYC
jgi:hypothetical protein